ncbi:MAG: molybdopterin-dependent oxidoreductase [Proteobacteria bacterium]|nr:molybdopterin-dependent oxidoreductase [Pseudomonadota bacterium]
MKVEEDVKIPTACGRCYASCGIKVRRVNGVAVQIEGNPDTDMGARGGLCAKGIAGLQVLYDPNRLNVPLRRTNPEKGLYVDPKWNEISWEEALTEIAEKLGKILKEDPRKLLIQITTIRPLYCSFVIKPLFDFGVTNIWVGGGGLHCGSGAHAIAGMVNSSWSIVPDFQNCNYIIYFGASKGTAAGHSSMVSTRLAAEARDRGAKFVIFDPLCNYAGGKATEWIPLIPGTDGIIALTMCNILVNELGVVDWVFLKSKTNAPYLVKEDGRYVRDPETKRCLVWDMDEGRAVPHDYKDIPNYRAACAVNYALEGEYRVNGVTCRPSFQLLKEHLKQYTPEKASQVSTVPAETIRRIANEFATEAKVGSTVVIDGHEVPFRPASAVLFRGGEGHENSFHTCFAVSLLSSIVGSHDVCGGTLGWPARSLGFPETGKFTFSPYKGVDGFLQTDYFGPAVLHPGKRVNEMKNTWDGLVGRVIRETVHDENGKVIVESGSTITRDIAYALARLPERMIKVEPFVTGGPWPLKEPEIRGNAQLKDIYPLGFDPGVFGASDQEEIWQKVNLPYRFEMLLSWGCNTPMSVASFDAVANSIKRIPFVVVSELFNTELTEGFADIVLPDTCYLELMSFSEGRGQNFNYPYGMDDWCYHVVQPVVPPKEQRRSFLEVMCDLLDRMNYRDRRNKSINDFVNFDEKHRLREDEEFTIDGLTDRVLKYWFGETHGLDYIKEHGFVRWKKKVEEAYWRYFVDCRIPVYLEFMVDIKEKMQKITERIGLSVDYTQYTPLVLWSPCSIHLLDSKEFDLYCFSYRDVLHTGSSTMEQPWLDEASAMNPYTYNICMHVETGKKKGLNDGDLIKLETPTGRSVTGTLKLMEGHHPQAISIAACSGHWAKGLPIARGKGTNFDNLLEIDLKHSDPVSLNIETAARVKVIKLQKG